MVFSRGMGQAEFRLTWGLIGSLPPAGLFRMIFLIKIAILRLHQIDLQAGNSYI
jgi:hypothetical protein